MESVRNLDQRPERIGYTEGPHVLGGDKDGKAVSLETPEFVVIHEVIELLSDGCDFLLLRAVRLELLNGLLRQVLECGPVSLSLLRDGRGWQED